MRSLSGGRSCPSRTRPRLADTVHGEQLRASRADAATQAEVRAPVADTAHGEGLRTSRADAATQAEVRARVAANDGLGGAGARTGRGTKLAAQPAGPTQAGEAAKAGRRVDSSGTASADSGGSRRRRGGVFRRVGRTTGRVAGVVGRVALELATIVADAVSIAIGAGLGIPLVRSTAKAESGLATRAASASQAKNTEVSNLMRQTIAHQNRGPRTEREGWDKGPRVGFPHEQAARRSQARSARRRRDREDDWVRVPGR